MAGVKDPIEATLRAALETLLIQHHGPRHPGRREDCTDYGCAAAVAALRGTQEPRPYRPLGPTLDEFVDERVAERESAIDRAREDVARDPARRARVDEHKQDILGPDEVIVRHWRSFDVCGFCLHPWPCQSLAAASPAAPKENDHG